MSLSKITFYPVGNGGMTYLQLNDSEKISILIDMNIRSAVDNENNDEYYDVSSHLRENLKENSDGRPYVDYFILTHNDDDHINGLKKHFHLGSIEEYQDPNNDEEAKIIINEIWGTSRFWKRASDDNKLSDDAKAFNKEMKRRVSLFEKNSEIQEDGDKVTIIGIDPESKTDDLDEIVIEIGEYLNILDKKLNINILGPIEQQEDEEDDDFVKSNRNSIILQISVTEQEYDNEILITGDTDVFVWENMKKMYNSENVLDYDIMLAPHHCSRHSVGRLIESSFEESTDAIDALNNCNEGAFIISHSKPIKDNDDDPPSQDAKDIYTSIVANDHFLCTEEYPKEKDVAPIIILLTSDGPKLKSSKAKSKLQKASEKATGEVYPHGA
ncbi:MAG: hypothetical protein KAT68_17635 [Bacteroidales bacterium]|nr:hypothetical protein [Bacteroidales bacterium]